jgi:hypothetical protein
VSGYTTLLSSATTGHTTWFPCACARVTTRSRARAKAWCLCIHAEASLSAFRSSSFFFTRFRRSTPHPSPPPSSPPRSRFCIGGEGEIGSLSARQQHATSAQCRFCSSLTPRNNTLQLNISIYQYRGVVVRCCSLRGRVFAFLASSHRTTSVHRVGLHPREHGYRRVVGVIVHCHCRASWSLNSTQHEGQGASLAPPCHTRECVSLSLSNVSPSPHPALSPRHGRSGRRCWCA